MQYGCLWGKSISARHKRLAREENDVLETWKAVVGYEGIYEASNQGRVRSLEHKNTRGQVVRPIIRATKPNNRGYIQICLSKDGRQEYKLLHRIVAEAFISNPLNLPQINHIDENKNNNNISNLEWCTNMYNRHFGTGLERAMANRDHKEIARKTALKKLKPIKEHLPNGDIREWLGAAVAARDLGITRSCISHCCRTPGTTYKQSRWEFA